MTDTHKIAIVGGTGDLGSGLAKRWARAGHQIVIGSRDVDVPRKPRQNSTKMPAPPRFPAWRMPMPLKPAK